LKAKFRLEYAPRFSRRLRNLERQTQIRILREVQILADNPNAGKSLRGQWEGKHSFRIGDYRVIYVVSNDKVILLTVGHRKSIYE
jgi:mRNA-degrading endonuclease RelE of RelBE toxin-antitoxin system